MTPQAVLVCLALGIVIGWVAARFQHHHDGPRFHHVGPPPSNVRVIPGIYDQERA